MYGAAQNFFIPTSPTFNNAEAELQQQRAHHAIGAEVRLLADCVPDGVTGGSFEPPVFCALTFLVEAYFPNIG